MTDVKELVPITLSAQFEVPEVEEAALLSGIPEVYSPYLASNVLSFQNCSGLFVTAYFFRMLIV